MPVMTGGFTNLPTIGELSYNGVQFDPLHTSSVSSRVEYTADGRTAKYLEWTITVDAFVTLQKTDKTLDPTWSKLIFLLGQPGGVLTYSGKGLGNSLVVNLPGGKVRDVANGPKPEVLEFVPLGGSRSAKVKWTVKTKIPAYTPKQQFPVLQFCYGSTVSYDMDGYSKLKFSGVLEIPLTRNTIGDQTTPQTVDNYRQTYISSITNGIDLTRFKITNRQFNIANDKRTMDFVIEAEELPPMANPVDVITAKGNFDCSPKHGSAGLVNWTCMLSCSYVVPKNRPQRLAWRAFVLLLAERMFWSQFGEDVPVDPPGQSAAAFAASVISGVATAQNSVPGPIFPPVQAGATWSAAAFAGFGVGLPLDPAPPPPRAQRRVLLTSFRFGEGLYEESRTVHFSASWRLITSFRSILVASGWRQIQSKKTCNPELWATSIGAISGANGNLVNMLNPAAQAIVDFGSDASSLPNGNIVG